MKGTHVAIDRKQDGLCLANHHLEELGVEWCEVESSSTHLNSSWKGREKKVLEATPSKVRERAGEKSNEEPAEERT